MTGRLRVGLVSIIALSLIPSFVTAQGKSTARVRGLFIDKKADGLEIKVLTDKGAIVSPSQEFKAGDAIRIRFQSNFKGFVYFVNVTPGGATRVIYNREVESDRVYDMPAPPAVIAFDKEKGTEILKVVMSHDRITIYEDALRTSNGELGKSAQSVAEELKGADAKKQSKQQGKNGKVSEQVGIVQPKEAAPGRCRGLALAIEGQEMRCRGLVLATGKENRNEGSVVAISDAKGTKLKTGEVAVFEIRLKHI
ncbi:MAG TPA: DUF4384 domain-containing protein [Blastocatellia bacterium]|nr:DUF4384 domain-containing protein [Blastocatellia bacterium]